MEVLLGVREVEEPDLVLVAIHGVKEAIDVVDNAEEVVQCKCARAEGTMCSKSPGRRKESWGSEMARWSSMISWSLRESL